MPTREFAHAFDQGTYNTEESQRYYRDAQVSYDQNQYEEHKRPVKLFDPGKIVYHVDLCFSLPRRGCPQGPVEVNINQNDLIRTWQQNSSMNLLRSDLSRVVPTSIKIVGTTFPAQSPYALQLFDAKGVPLFDTHGANYSSGNECDCYGFPLFMDDKTIFRSNGVVDDHVREYANISIKDIKNDCLLLKYPSGLEYALVPKVNGMYFAWVLEVKERGSDSIMTNPAYQDANHPEYFRLYKKDFDRCISYYEKALEQIKFVDFTRMKARLVPRDHHILSQDPTDLRQETVILEVTARAGDVSDETISHRCSKIRMNANHAGKKTLSRLTFGELTKYGPCQ